MTEEQKKLKAERDRRYREKKKAEKSKEQAMFTSSATGEYITYTETIPGHFAANILTREEAQPDPEADMQAPIDPAPESVMQAPDSELQERYMKELEPVPVLDETLTDFDVFKRRHERMFR